MDRKRPGPLRLVLCGICLAAAIAVLISILSYRNDTRAETTTRGNPTSAEALGPTTLDPQAFQGEAREAYKIAKQRPDLFMKLHCYCGCDRTLGHRNLLDCYRVRHAASCEICIGEAQDADAMAKHGAVVAQIREALQARYGQLH
jgi:Protein of unknown function with PCYCGC motif